MNSKPHAHELRINDMGAEWIVVYGDQVRGVRKPFFRNPETVLKNAVKKVIRDHDEKSEQAGRNAEQNARAIAEAKKLAPDYEPAHYDPAGRKFIPETEFTEWPSKQPGKVK